MNVLLIEDNLVIGAIARQRLERAGFIVEWVTDANSAKRALRRGSRSLVILDLALPGRELASILSALQQLGATMPTVIATIRDRMRRRISDLALARNTYSITPVEVGRVLHHTRSLLRDFEPILGSEE